MKALKLELKSYSKITGCRRSFAPSSNYLAVIYLLTSDKQISIIVRSISKSIASKTSDNLYVILQVQSQICSKF